MTSFDGSGELLDHDKAPGLKKTLCFYLFDKYEFKHNYNSVTQGED